MGEARRRRLLDPDNYGKPKVLSPVNQQKRQIQDYLIRQGLTQEQASKITAGINSTDFCVITLQEFAQACYQEYGAGIVLLFKGGVAYQDTFLSPWQKQLTLLAGDYSQRFPFQVYSTNNKLLFTTLVGRGNDPDLAARKLLLPISWQERLSDYLLSSVLGKNEHRQA